MFSLSSYLIRCIKFIRNFQKPFLAVFGCFGCFCIADFKPFKKTQKMQINSILLDVLALHIFKEFLEILLDVSLNCCFFEFLNNNSD